MGRRLIYIRPQGYLPLTTAWIAATSETDTTILNALNTFEAGLIANGMNSGDLIAYYPMVGGNSTKHSYNFMNTALYNLSFVGGWTHSATGALPNGTNAYANTGINASTVLTQNNSHLGFYSRTDTISTGRVSIGAGSLAASRFHLMYLKNSGNASCYNTSSVAGQFATATNANSQGFYLSNKTSAASLGLTLDKNGLQIAANMAAIAANNYPNINIFISTYNGLAEFDNKECAGATVGMGLNTTKRGQLEDMVNALNTSLSRNVY
jgi:hypothetical protein